MQLRQINAKVSLLIYLQTLRTHVFVTSSIEPILVFAEVILPSNLIYDQRLRLTTYARTTVRTPTVCSMSSWIIKCDAQLIDESSLENQLI